MTSRAYLLHEHSPGTALARPEHVRRFMSQSRYQMPPALLFALVLISCGDGIQDPCRPRSVAFVSEGLRRRPDGDGGRPDPGIAEGEAKGNRMLARYVIPPYSGLTKRCD